MTHALNIPHITFLYLSMKDKDIERSFFNNRLERAKYSISHERNEEDEESNWSSSPNLPSDSSTSSGSLSSSTIPQHLISSKSVEPQPNHSNTRASLASHASPVHPRPSNLICPCCPELPHWSVVTSVIVRNAPCFWCCCNCFFTQLEASATYRSILSRLNILCAFVTLIQIGMGCFIGCTLLLNRDAHYNERVDDILTMNKGSSLFKEIIISNIWTPSGHVLAMAIMGIVLFVTMIVTRKYVLHVNILGAIRYLWILYWLIPMEMFFVIALFDYHRVTDVWIKHWWSGSSMVWFRKLLCEKGTANGKCAVPVGGGREYNDVNEWCNMNFDGETNCINIREDATMLMSTYSYFFFYICAVIGLFLSLLLLLALAMLEGIISAPIVQSSKEANVPRWLSAPTVGCAIYSYLLLSSTSSIFKNDNFLSIYWIGICYVVAGSSFFLSAWLGWFISYKTVLDVRDKMHKQLSVYAFIGMIVVAIISLGSIFIASLLHSVDLVYIDLDEKLRATIACYVGTVNSCTNCEALTSNITLHVSEICTEWNREDVLKIMQTQLKQSASLAAIMLMYALTALRFGFRLKSIVSSYEVDYV